MNKDFSIDSLCKGEISGDIFPYSNGNFSEVNDAISNKLSVFLKKIDDEKSLKFIETNSGENLSYVQTCIGNQIGEEIKTDLFSQKYYEGITCIVSVMAPIYYISAYNWHVTKYNTGQIVNTFQTPFLNSSNINKEYSYIMSLFHQYMGKQGFITLNFNEFSNTYCNNTQNIFQLLFYRIEL